MKKLNHLSFWGGGGVHPGLVSSQSQGTAEFGKRSRILPRLVVSQSTAGHKAVRRRDVCR